MTVGAVPCGAVVPPADLVVQLVHQQHAGIFVGVDEIFLLGETCVSIKFRPRKDDTDQSLWVGSGSQVTFGTSGCR